MGYIREKKLKKGNVRYQVEVRLKGHPILSHKLKVQVNIYRKSGFFQR